MIGMLVLALVVAGFLAAYRHKYPYGHSHCCIIALQLALQTYADEHGGKFPAGQASPEAALSLLHRECDLSADLLRGMTVPEKTVQEILDAGGLLGPESCGWHYVPGLTLADDPELALLWCKEPLGHNGERSKDGGRQVVFVGGYTKWIPGNQWEAFLENQKKAVVGRIPREMKGNPLVVGSIEMPDGSRVDHVDAAYSLVEESKGPESSGNGRLSGHGFNISQLLWYRAPLDNGQVTRTLSFSDLVSDPVTVVFENGIPDTREVVFRMRRKK